MEEKLRKLWAKSDGTTIREHTDKLLENLKKLKEEYGDIIEERIPDSMRGIFWQTLELACEYHDYGKVHYHFQRKLGNKNVKPPKGNLPEVRHNLLSPAFLPEDKNPVVRKLAALAIIHHHKHDAGKEEVEKVREVLEKEFGKELNYKNLIKYREDEILKKLAKDKNLEEESVRKFYIMLKGCLLRIDHASSNRYSPYVETYRKKEPEGKVREFLQGKGSDFNDLQRFVLENREDNLLVCASTGYGKTEAGFIFLKDKGFFTLPVRVSANAIYERAKGVFGEELVGLLHSSSLLEMALSEDEANIYWENIVLDHHLTSNFAKPIIVSTPDQIVPFVFKYPGYEKIASLLAYSRVVFDEPQLFEPHTMGFLVKGIEKITHLGGKVMVMSATLPPFVEEDLSFLDFKRGKFLTEKVRHNLKVVRRSIKDFTEDIRRLAEEGKVLVVVNTVKRAIELKEILPEAQLLHSQFILKDRKEKEKQIKDFFDNADRGVWITTQLAEVSLDLDADFLVTELSTVDSLLQRMGRVNRRGEKPVDNPNVFILTEECSGIGSVYREAIHEETKKIFRDGPITEEEKLGLLEEVYKKIEQVDQGYKEDYEKAKRFIENLWETDEFKLEKEKAQQLFRDIYTKTIIPEKFRDDLENGLLREYINNKDINERVKLLAKILEYTVTVPEYKVKGKQLEPVKKLKNVYWLKADYSPETGVEE